MARKTRGSAASTRWLLVAFLGCMAVLGAAPAAQADHQDEAYFTCRASALQIDLLNQGGPDAPLIEPVVANGEEENDGPECEDDFASLVNVDEGTGDLDPIPIEVFAQGVYAQTSLTGESGPRDQQVASARSGAANVVLEVGPEDPVTGDPPLRIEIIGLTSEASVSCQNGAPVFTRDFEFAKILVNDEEVDLADLGQAIEDALGPLGPLAPLVSIDFGEEVNEGTAATDDEVHRIRAAHIQVLSGLPGENSPLLDLIVAESIVDRHGDVCEPECPAGSVPDPNDPTRCVRPAVCPQGSTPDPNNPNQCLLPKTCPEGSRPHETNPNLCVISGQPQCPQGSTPDPNNPNQCLLPKTCPQGTEPDPNNANQCLIPRGCPAGSQPNPNNPNQCLISGPPACPQGSSPDPGNPNQCVLPGTPGPAVCPAGSTRVGDQCVLPATGGGDVPVGGFLVPLQALLGFEAFSGSPCSNPRFGGEFGILGTLGDDFITGTNGSDRIFSLAGDDRVSGGRGDDCIEGAEGRDNLDGSNGDDFLLGGADRDIMSGGSGRDQFDGGAGKDKMTGGSGVDRFSGGADRDKMSGGLGNDIISGGGGGDYIEAGQGRDTVNGGAGNDAINVAEAGPGRDTANCGAGRDTVRANPDDRLRGCEKVFRATRSRR